ncbi:MAG: trypsin-like peptidase domain-containing protein [Rhodoferax sp.]|nr:trypsin-like peptidase domain-containing protein [Rhodoferax sp.]
MFDPFPRLRRVWAALVLAAWCVVAAQAQEGAKPPAQRNGSEPAQVSHDAQRAYESSRDKLVQIRTLLRNTNTQSSVGSGFFVSADGLIITNFHVASQLALEPDRYRGVYVPVDGKQADLELLAFDVLHDLALLRVKDAGPQRPALSFRARDAALQRGERLYSLGNPLDIGFAVTEGTYNGLVQRSFYPRIFFGGAINPGMSGGPVIDEAGQVIGVNVSKRLDGELVSFLVPAEFAQALLARAATATALTRKAHAEVTRQLVAHQEQVTQRFISTPFKAQRHGGYSVPVPDDALARCWGRARDPDFKAFDLERTNCQQDSQLFAGDITTGFIRVRYEAYDAPKFSALRFASMYSDSMANERFAVRATSRMTAAECSERFIDRDGMAMRAVVCLNAYRKFQGLYNVSVLVTSLNRPTQGVQGRLDANGFSFDNSLALVAYYLNGFKWEGAR